MSYLSKLLAIVITGAISTQALAQNSPKNSNLTHNEVSQNATPEYSNNFSNDYLDFKKLLQTSPSAERDVQLQALLNKLNATPLAPFAMYHWLMTKKDLTWQEIAELDKSLPAFVNTSTLKQRWTIQQAKSQNWQNLIQHKNQLPKTLSEQCYIHHAEHKASKATKLANHTKMFLQRYWEKGITFPQSCNPLITQWKKQNSITQSMDNYRVWAAYKKNKRSTLRELSQHSTFTFSRRAAKNYLSLRKNPLQILSLSSPFYVKKLLKTPKGRQHLFVIFPSFVRQLNENALPKGLHLSTIESWAKQAHFPISVQKEWKKRLVKHFFDKRLSHLRVG